MLTNAMSGWQNAFLSKIKNVSIMQYPLYKCYNYSLVHQYDLHHVSEVLDL